MRGPWERALGTGLLVWVSGAYSVPPNRPAWACGRTRSLAELHSRPQTRWINADCLGMTVSSGPHKKSAEREREGGRDGKREREKIKEKTVKQRDNCIELQQISSLFHHFIPLLLVFIYRNFLVLSLCFSERRTLYKNIKDPVPRKYILSLFTLCALKFSKTSYCCYSFQWKHKRRNLMQLFYIQWPH